MKHSNEVNTISDEELHLIVNAIAKDATNAKHYFDLFMSLDKAYSQFRDVFNTSNTFWNFSKNALRDSALFSLCRLYDPHKYSASLVKLMKQLLVNPNHLESESFIRRMNAEGKQQFLPSMLERRSVPTREEIQKDLASIVETEPMVEKLLVWRDKYFAHRDLKEVLSGNRILAEYPISFSEIEELVNRGFDLYNKYLGIYKEHFWSSTPIGHDDYMRLLKASSVGLQLERNGAGQGN